MDHVGGSLVIPNVSSLIKLYHSQAPGGVQSKFYGLGALFFLVRDGLFYPAASAHPGWAWGSGFARLGLGVPFRARISGLKSQFLALGAMGWGRS